MFDNIDTEKKAYLLGWIASNGSISRHRMTLGIHKKDRAILETLRDIINPKLPITLYRSYLILFEMNSVQICEKLCEIFGIIPGKKSHTIEFPILSSEQLQWTFIRGVFDGDGSVQKPSCDRSPECCIASVSENMKEGIGAFCKIKNHISSKQIVFTGTNALDFLSKIYDYASPSLRLERKYQQYIQWSNWTASLHGLYGKIPHCKFSKTDRDAIRPSKIRASDEGYDLTIIKEYKKISDCTVLYDTGIKVRPEFGYYFDIVPRSSLVKSGYCLSNSVGIIDRSYCGSIKIALTRIDPSIPELSLPLRCIQLIMRKSNHYTIEEVKTLDETERGDGGFGSTGTRTD